MTIEHHFQATSSGDDLDIIRRIGAFLADHRRTRGEDLVDIAAYLKIKPAYLQAIEAGDHSAIPGNTYALGFIRSYADYLGLDTDAIVGEARFALAKLNTQKASNVESIKPKGDSRRPTLQIVAISAAVAIAMIAVWQVRENGELLPRNLAELPAEIGENVIAYVDPDGEIFGAEDSAGSTARRQSTPSAALLPDTASDIDAVKLAVRNDAEPDREPEPEEVLTRIDASSAIAAEPSAGGQIASGEEAAESASSAVELLAALQARESGERRPAFGGSQDVADARVVLVATEESWVQIRSTSRDYVRTRTLLAGERLAMPDRDDLSLWTGNAGGLQIIVDGETLGPPGARREVIKALPLAPISLKEQLGEISTAEG
jgi:cytoskeleton protein RodZ